MLEGLQHDGPQGDPPLMRELHRVGGIVEQRLLQPGGIAQQRHVDLLDFKYQRQSLVFRLGTDHGLDVGHDVVDGDRGAFQDEGIGFDLGEIQDRIDGLQQMLARHRDLPQPLGLSGRKFVPQHEIRHAGDGIERRPDLVAHVRQEGALGLVGGFRRHLGLHQGQFGGFAAADVRLEGDQPGRLAFSRPLVVNGHLDGKQVAVLGPLAGFELNLSLALDHVPDPDVVLRREAWVDVGDGQLKQFIDGVAQALGGMLIRIDETPGVEIGPGDADANLVHGELGIEEFAGALFNQSLQIFPMLMQRAFGLLAFRDVPAYRLDVMLAADIH